MNVPMGRTARLSWDGVYRYELTRRWSFWSFRPYVTFVMLNPSTADAALDDPTIRRCIGFAKRWRMGGLAVVNLYAYRATSPKELVTAEHPVGPDNDNAIHDACVGARAVVAAWGATSGGAYHHKRIEQVLALYSGPWLCLGKTKDGHPRHPLYVPALTRPEPLY